MVSNKFFNVLHIAWAEIRTRDRGMILGPVWTLINPILLFAALFSVFGGTRSGPSNSEFGAYLLAGLLLWAYFSGLVTSISNSNNYRAHFLRYTTIPYTSAILGSVLASLFFFIIEVIISSLLFGMFFRESPLAFAVRIITAGIEATPFFIVLGFTILWASLFIPDYARIWSLALRLGFFLTPIFYRLEAVSLGSWLALNPLVYYLEIARGHMSSFNNASLLLIAIIHLLSCAALVWITEKHRSSFAEFGI